MNKNRIYSFKPEGEVLLELAPAQTHKLQMKNENSNT